jgi:hypothetical protein
MEASWDHPRLKKYAALLVARLERPRLPERPPSRGIRSAEWFLSRVASKESAGEPIRSRFERPTGDIPVSLKTAMTECQKPFQLWNVTRVEKVDDATYEKVPPYVVGAVAAPDRTGQPGRVVPASRLVHGAREESALVRAEAFGAKRRLPRLMSESAEEQGLGLPDEG